VQRERRGTRRGRGDGGRHGGRRRRAARRGTGDRLQKRRLRAVEPRGGAGLREPLREVVRFPLVRVAGLADREAPGARGVRRARLDDVCNLVRDQALPGDPRRVVRTARE
jgi:hypothetical protein